MVFRDGMQRRIRFWLCRLPCFKDLEFWEDDGDTVRPQPRQELIRPWNCCSYDGQINSGPRETMSEMVLRMPNIQAHVLIKNCTVDSDA